MKLIQLNAWMGRLTPQIVKFIKAERPDIMTAQEVFSVDGPVIFPDNMFNCFDQIKAAGEFPYSFFSPVWGLAVAHHVANFGNAIFSKFALEDQQTFFTHGQYNPDLTPENRIENTRNAQFVAISHGGQKFNLVNHHAHWEMTPEGTETSTERMKLIRDKIKDLDGPVVFAGDFNVKPGTSTLSLFDGLLEDLAATHQVQSTLSLFGKVKNVACDHILVSSGIEVQDFRVADKLVSDHQAVILEFDLKS